jgi:hypothetical protein
VRGIQAYRVILGIVLVLAVSVLASADTRTSDEPIKAVYLSYYGVGAQVVRDRILSLMGGTELNSVVIDVKSDEGFIPYETHVPLASHTSARGPIRVKEFDDLLSRLKHNGVYTIARIVVFKDNVLARHRPEWAVRDQRTGAPWRDREQSAWIDPFQRESWPYALAIAREAALKGFNEIQFDYLRFPSDGPVADARYSGPNTQAARIGAITEFLALARQALRGTAAALAVDVFGYTAFNQDDTGVGQRVEDLAPLVDFLCPMTYPSSYHFGIPGYPNPVAHPYEVVYETVRRMRERTSHTRVQIRPWIQDFRDYAFDRRSFGVEQVRAELKAADDAGAVGWMLWNPGNRYTTDALTRRAP